MPPQFFKDAHSVLNNKFTPRAFTLNLDPNDGKGNDSIGVHSLESTDDSLLAPRAVSTAPSSDSSSRYFGAYSGGKSHKLANKQVHRDTDNGVSDDSSTDNIENFIKTPVADSTHSESALENSGSTSRASTAGSDDLLITDVREISLDLETKKEFQCKSTVQQEERGEQDPRPSGSQRFHAAETSADLVMEALVKSQKLCSQFKEELAHANRKISIQEEEITIHKRTHESSKANIKSFKNHLHELELKSKELCVANKHEHSNFTAVKSALDELHSQVNILKNETVNQKKIIEHLKQIKLSSFYEIERKSKEIELLQHRVDETSGLLSEQKIKSSELEKTLEHCRREYDDKISTALKESENSQKALKGELTNVKKVMESSFGAQLKELKPFFGSQKKQMDTKIDDLQESLSRSLKITEDLVSGKLDQSSKFWVEASANIEELKISLKPKLEKIGNDQTFVNTVCTQILDGYRILVGEIKNDHTKTVEISSVCKDIFNLIEILQESYQKNQNDFVESSKISELNRQVEEKLTGTKSELDIITRERDALLSEIDGIKKNSNELQNTKEELRCEVEKLESMIRSKDLNLKQSEQKIQKCKTNCDSKLRTQIEIHKLVSAEHNKLLHDLEMKSSEILELQKDVEKLQLSNNQKGEIINSIIQDKSQKESAYVKLQGEMLVLANEKERLCDKIDAQLKSNKTNTVKDTLVPNTQESFNDLELTTSLDASNKPEMKRKVIPNLNPPALQKRHNVVTKYSKRKKLLDDADTNALFDEFDLDLDEQVATLPKRYTKRKKTIGAS